MKSGPQQVAKRIRDELAEEKVVLAHVERDWLRFVETGDDAYLKATAYDLHGFYGGLERIFVKVSGLDIRHNSLESLFVASCLPLSSMLAPPCVTPWGTPMIL